MLACSREAVVDGVTIARMDAAADLEQRFLVRLDDAAAELRGRFPALNIHVYASSIGARTPLDGHSVFIDCLIPGASDDTSDNVGLEIWASSHSLFPGVRRRRRLLGRPRRHHRGGA